MGIFRVCVCVCVWLCVLGEDVNRWWVGPREAPVIVELHHLLTEYSRFVLKSLILLCLIFSGTLLLPSIMIMLPRAFLACEKIRRNGCVSCHGASCDVKCPVATFLRTDRDLMNCLFAVFVGRKFAFWKRQRNALPCLFTSVDALRELAASSSFQNPPPWLLRREVQRCWWHWPCLLVVSDANNTGGTHTHWLQSACVSWKQFWKPSSCFRCPWFVDFTVLFVAQLLLPNV